jgi:hypothetical protein
VVFLRRQESYADFVPSAKPSADQTALPAVLIGTVAWMIALVTLSAQGAVGPPAEGTWWWAVAAIGALSGLIGIPFLMRRRARMAATQPR